MGYPGGPKIDKLAKEAQSGCNRIPRAHVDDAPYDFSFSGIKSAVLNYINSANMQGKEINRADVAASFQKRGSRCSCFTGSKAGKRMWNG